MRLVQIARYSVKSLQGDFVSTAEIELDGVRPDRRISVADRRTTTANIALPSGVGLRADVWGRWSGL